MAVINISHFRRFGKQMHLKLFGIERNSKSQCCIVVEFIRIHQLHDITVLSSCSRERDQCCC